MLAPIVSHADDARLLPGVLEAVGELAALTPVAVVSGRSIEDLSRFGFPDHVEIFGTHGLERRDEGPVELGQQEQRRYERLARLAADAADQAGDGAWVEVKPAGVVLHVREAPPDRSAASVAELHRQAADVTGAHVLPGHGVVELLARVTSKATAIAALCDEVQRRRRRLRRRRPHRRGGVCGARRRRVLDQGRTGPDGGQVPARRATRGAAVPPRAHRRRSPSRRCDPGAGQPLRWRIDTARTVM